MLEFGQHHCKGQYFVGKDAKTTLAVIKYHVSIIIIIVISVTVDYYYYYWYHGKQNM